MQTTGSIIWSLFLLVCCLGLVGVILFYWFKKSDDPMGLLVRLGVTAVTAVIVIAMAAVANDELSKFFAVIIALFGGLVFAILWGRPFCEAVAKPFTSLFDGGEQEVEPQPFYSIAEAKRKLGKYGESVAEIRKQLEMFPNDFTGWMMLAEVYAENLNDFSSAQNTIEQLLTQEGHPPRNISYALNRLADWHLKYNQDPASAKTILERIPLLFPETEQANMALQRISHLATTDELIQRIDRPAITMKQYEQNIGLKSKEEQGNMSVDDPAAMAAQYVKHLESYPQDYEAREKLALIYAEHYHRIDLAADQLEQLIAVPGQPQKHVARWLNLLADLHLKASSDIEAARRALQRIIDLFPHTAPAENAMNRMAFLKMEMKSQQKSQAIKLGSYEQNIGLKG